MKTLIHKNLHNGLWSITQRGLVVGYCTAACLVDCDVKEDAKKAAFSRAGNKRTVHLWVRGSLASVTDFQPLKGRELVFAQDGYDHPGISLPATYNPKRQDPGFQVNGSTWFGGRFAMFNRVGMSVA